MHTSLRKVNVHVPLYNFYINKVENMVATEFIYASSMKRDDEEKVNTTSIRLACDIKQL